MKLQIEELINDPGNHAILRSLASEEEITFDEITEITGIREKRLREKLNALEKKGFLEIERSNYPAKTVLKQEHRKELEETRDSLRQFMEEKKDLVERENSRELERLKELRNTLEQDIEETELVSRERKLQSRVESVNRCIEMIQDSEDSSEGFEAFSHSHRTLRKLGHRDDEFRSFNPFRKLKALNKLEEVLGEKPEEQEPRKFFGSRWITQDKLDQEG